MDRRKSMSTFTWILKLLHVINYKLNNNFNWKEEKLNKYSLWHYSNLKVLWFVWDCDFVEKKVQF